MVEQPLEVVQDRRRRITELERAARDVLNEVAGLFEGGPDSVEWLREQRNR